MSTNIRSRPLAARTRGRVRAAACVMPAQIPAIVYGGHAAPKSIQLEHEKTWLASQNEWFYSSILTLDIDGKVEKVLLRDMQRHPYKQQIMHLDFQRVNENEAIRVAVPLHFLNVEKSPAGKAADVVVTHELNEVQVSCLPKDLPEFIEIDLAEPAAPATPSTCRRSSCPRAWKCPSSSSARTTTSPSSSPSHGKRRSEEAADRSRRSAGRRRKPAAKAKAEVIAASGTSSRAAPARRVTRWLACVSSSGWAIPVPNTPGPGTTPGSVLWTRSPNNAGARFGLESKLFGETGQGRHRRPAGLAAQAGDLHEPQRQVGHRRVALLEDRAGRSAAGARRTGPAAGHRRGSKFDGGHGGQNGLRDTMRLLGTAGSTACASASAIRATRTGSRRGCWASPAATTRPRSCAPSTTPSTCCRWRSPATSTRR